jgi:taurine dioxygenase
MSVVVKPLDGNFGAEVSGFELPDISPEDAAALRQAFVDHHVLVVHGPGLSDDDLVAFGSCFGPLEKSLHETPLASRQEIMVISNIRENGKELGRHPDGELIWHFDRVHQPVPNKAGVLHALETPSTGGETLFADMCQAYETLPPSTKSRLEGLTALNTFTYGANHAGQKDATSGPHAIHPAVRRLPETGRKSLYVCRLMTDRLNGLPESEGRDLLDELLAHAEDPRFTYMHKWRVGDIVVWDNRCTMHARNDFNGDERRLIKRVTVSDTLAPVA